MGKKVTESKGVNILLAILIAAALWVYVTSVVNPDTTLTVRNISVAMVGENVLNGKGLMIDPGTNLTMDLNLVGNRNAVVKASTAGNIIISADVTNIESAGEYSLPCKITLPNTVTAENAANKTIRLTVSKMLSKTVEVRGSFTGSVPEGYRTNDFTMSPAAVNIQGPETIINQIEYALVTVSGTDLAQTFKGDLGFEYITSQGKVLKDSKIVANVDTVNVILPVVKTLEVPLIVEFINGGGATQEDVTYTITPETIQISGEEKDVAPLQDKSITLGIIDLAKVEDTDSISFPIVLASELTNDSGVSEATVTITISGLSTKTVETSKIEIINAPSGLVATPVTQSLQVRVRGAASALSGVFDYQIRAVCDLSGQTLSPGQFVFPVKIYLDVNGKIGVVGKGYSIVVSVK